VPTPIDLDYIRHALSVRSGWVELGAILVCIGVAWLVDRRIHLATVDGSRIGRMGAGSINRIIFPVAALSLLYLSRGVFTHFELPAFYPIAIPAMVAFALIRLCVYALRNMFESHEIGSASERAVSFTIWGALLLYYLGVLPEIGAALDDVKLPIGRAQFSVLDLARDGIVVIIALVCSLWLSNMLQARLMGLSHVDINLRVVSAKFLRAIVLLLGVLVALSTVGIDLTVLSVFGGAVGVGIGLGLQKLASNYIAGFTILLDRSIRVGDMITVDTRFGEVSKVTSRYVVVRNLDGVEAIVPNETLVTTTVLNHSYTSKDIKLGIPVQVSYDSDLDVAMHLMLGVAIAQPRVLKAPLAPFVQLLTFGDNGINLELGVWINDPQNGQGNLKSEINIGIWRAFKEHGIVIPYPRRDIHVLTDAVPSPMADGMGHSASTQGGGAITGAESASEAGANPLKTQADAIK
jgi:small-conductance mechanosensitive channel